MVEKKIVRAYGPVIVEDGLLLVTHDGKDDFYKIPGGKPLDGELPHDTCRREFLEETGLECEVLDALSTLEIEKDSSTRVELYHFRARITKPHDHKGYTHEGHEVKWIPVVELKQYNVAPNVMFLYEQGELSNG